MTRTKNISDETISELKTISEDIRSDNRVYDERMDSFEDDLRETNESIEAELERQKATFIPPKMHEEFAKRGLTLNWIRYLLQGKVDRLSIQKAIRKGYEYVRPEEIKKFQKEMPSEGTDFAKGDVILAGDLVLMRCKTDLVDRRRKLTAHRARELESANDRRIRNDGFKYSRKSQSQTLYKTGQRSSFGNDVIE